METFDTLSNHMDEGIRQVGGTVGVVLAPDPTDGTPGWSVYYLSNGGVIEWTDDRDEVRNILAGLGKLDGEWEIGYMPYPILLSSR